MTRLPLVPVLGGLAAVVGVALVAREAKAAAAARVAALPRYDVALPAPAAHAVDVAAASDPSGVRLRQFAIRLAPYPIAQSAVLRAAAAKGS